MHQPGGGTMMQMKKLFLLVALTFSFSLSASISFSDTQLLPRPGQITDDAELVKANRTKKPQNYLEAGNITVTKLLKDDNSGLRHQKWEAALSNGATIQVVYNSDMGNRVPVKVGDRFGLGGQFVWGRQNMGLMHWLHEDRKDRRPDGYVYHNGIVYGLSNY